MRELKFNTINLNIKKEIIYINQLIKIKDFDKAKIKLSELENKVTDKDLLLAIQKCKTVDSWKEYKKFLNYFK